MVSLSFFGEEVGGLQHTAASLEQETHLNSNPSSALTSWRDLRGNTLIFLLFSSVQGEQDHRPDPRVVRRGGDNAHKNALCLKPNRSPTKVTVFPLFSFILPLSAQEDTETKVIPRHHP